MKKILTLAFIAALTLTARAVTIGADLGYLLDSEEAFVSVRAGGQLSASDRASHRLELELGFTEESDAGVSGEIIPLTLNYRVESRNAIGWGFFAGLGAGAARAQASGFGLSFHDTTFAVQGFGGLRYAFSETTALHLGLKYIWLDEVEFAGTSADLGDDVAITAGFSFRF